MKCIIVDGEDMARRSLTRICEKIEDLEVVTTCRNAEIAIRALDRQPVDVLLLDSHVVGLDLFKGLKNFANAPHLIFVTDDREPTDDIYGFEAADYISKPVSQKRLGRAIDRVRRRAHILRPREDRPEIYVKVDGRLIRLLHEDIIYVQNQDSGLRFHTREGDFNVEGELREMAEKLGQESFLKVNRNFVINLKEIVNVGDTEVVLTAITIPISRSRRPVIMHHISRS